MNNTNLVKNLRRLAECIKKYPLDAIADSMEKCIKEAEHEFVWAANIATNTLKRRTDYRLSPEQRLLLARDILREYREQK